MSQTVLLGLGGTGARVVNNVAKELRKHDMQLNDGDITCAVLDTNQADNDLILDSGTKIPVIPTCDERDIDSYLRLYANREPSKWCPYSRNFGAESMIDGASEIRVKSRIAFMDTVASGKILELQQAIEKIFHNKPGTPEKIRVMIVSSLSGGTGSGMFIQVALWLRKFFEERNCQATIRGIFLLPDIFIRTVSNVRDNPRKVLYNYANAYAAIRELNAINKAIKGNITLERPIVIDDLFDSREPCARPVFDYAFFIDDADANGAAFEGIEDYEEIVAQIVYMQLYAPMHSELTSVEDNLFRAFDSCKDPVFGSCGTAKAVYPIASVAHYCALRAAKDSISEGWNRIDAEIQALKKEEELAELDGIPQEKRISPRDKFIELFDEKSQKTGASIGKSDRLFVSIKNDIKNEKTVRDSKGETKTEYTDKVDSFIKVIDEEIKKAITGAGDGNKIRSVADELPDPESKDNFEKDVVELTLKGIREREKELISHTLDSFDENCQKDADAIVRNLVPLDISAVNSYNERSLYGLFLKKDPNGGDFYVHPVAARYLLYKLSMKIEQKQRKLAPGSLRKLALEGDENTNPFDNPKTKKIETLEGYWDQLGIYISKAEIQHFIRAYKQFNEDNALKCGQYETELLTQKVLKALSERVNALVKEAEKMFEDFPKLVKQLDKDIYNNVVKTEGNLNKILYVFAKMKHKEAKYKSLRLDLTGRNNELNAEVVKSIYGKFCAKYRPNIDENQAYAEGTLIAVFREKIVESFAALIAKEHKDEIQLDIISAIKAECDYEAAHKGEKRSGQDIVNAIKDENDFLYALAAQNDDDGQADPFDQTNTAAAQAADYDRAIIGYRNRLSQMAAPFLRAKPDEELAVVSNIDGISIDTNKDIWMTTGDGQVLHMPLQTNLTFWGFHPKVATLYPNIGAALGANKTTASSEGYGINELYCYSSIYGVKAEAVDKFNEQKNGVYYKHYSAAINKMITNGYEVDTPHIDKTWHEFLPYVSSSRQEAATQKFYKAFWRAVAYGRIRLDNHERYVIGEQTTDSYGNVNIEYSPLLESGERIAATDVTRLIRALRLYPTFETMFTPQLEERFNRDVKGMTTYIGTDIVKGLVTDGDLNPVTMIVRYGASKGYNVTIKNNLVGSLSEIMREVASHYNMNRGDEQINDARIRLCHRIYEKSDMQRKGDFFETWIGDFRRLGLALSEEDNAADDAAAAVTDII